MDQKRQLRSLELSFPATELEARAGIATIASQLGVQGLPADRAGDVRIALAEAINNVVEHAYAGISPARIDISCHLRDDRLEILISDTGHPMPGGRPPAGAPASVEADIPDLPEGGFGWFLIRELTSEVRYEREDNANRLSLRFDLTGAAGARPQ